MNKLIQIDHDSQTATFETGIYGPELEEKLNKLGYSLGHFPDSFEYSTLGGWLATRSAGMNSDRYGKIEDMVISMNMVTPDGVIETPKAPRSATGPDLNHIILGSEGTLGIITQAVMKIHKNNFKEYRGIIVPDFEAGIKIAQECAQIGIRPSLLRLSNSDETKLSFSLKPIQKSLVQKFLKKIIFYFLNKVKNIDLEKACIIIIGFEGSKNEVSHQKTTSLNICTKYGGFDLGTSVGNAWYKAKYDYPYIRDYILNLGLVADVTETTVMWTDLLTLYNEVEENLKPLLSTDDGFPGYLGCHLSHSYSGGACLYFTFVTPANSAGQEAIDKYLLIKKKIVDTILRCRGTLSHHHSIGYEHLPWYKEYLGKSSINLLQSIKRNIDPLNICNPHRLIPDNESYSLKHYWPEKLVENQNI